MTISGTYRCTVCDQPMRPGLDRICETCRYGAERSVRGTGKTHGRIATYNAGCRCDECRVASRDAQRRIRAKRKAS